MNDEIGNFLIKFTTEGFDKVEKSLDTLNKGMDKLNDSFEKGNNKGESFFGALLKWDIVVGTITKSFRALKNEITDVFNVAEDMTTLFRKEQSLGVEAKVLERYGLLAKLNQGSQSDAYAFFENIQNLMLRASMPSEFNSEDVKGLALAGINWSYNGGLTTAQNRDAFLVALRDAFVRNMGDENKMSYLKKYVPQESIYSAFMAPEESFRQQMQWADNLRVLSREPERLQDVQDLRVEKLEWGQFWQKLDLQLTKPLADLYKALEPLQEPLEKLVERFGKWVSANSDKISGWVEKAAKWVANELPGILDKAYQALKLIFGALFELVKPGAWSFAKDFGKWLSGDMAWEDIDKKYGKEGGGFLGWALRQGNALGELLTYPTQAQAEWAKNYNTTNNYGSPVTVKAGTYPNDIVVQPTVMGPTGAMLSSLRK